MRFRKQFQLTTAIVMTLTAGVLLGLNLREQHDTFKHHDFHARGWPFWWAYDESPATKIDRQQLDADLQSAAQKASRVSLQQEFGYNGTDAAYLAVEKAPRRRGCDDGILISPPQLDLERITKLFEQSMEEVKMRDHVTEAHRHTAQHALLDSLLGLCVILAAGVGCEILLRRRFRAATEPSTYS